MNDNWALLGLLLLLLACAGRWPFHADEKLIYALLAAGVASIVIAMDGKERPRRKRRRR